MEILKLKNTITQIKKWTDGFSSMSNIAGERTSDLEGRSIANFQSKTQKEKQGKVQKGWVMSHSRYSTNCKCIIGIPRER